MNRTYTEHLLGLSQAIRRRLFCMMIHPIRTPQRIADGLPFASTRQNRHRPFQPRSPRGGAVSNFLFGDGTPKIKPHSWRASAYEQQVASPKPAYTPAPPRFVDPDKAWHRTSRGYRSYRKALSAESQLGIASRAACIGAATDLGTARGLRYGGAGGIAGGALGAFIGSLGCNAAGDLMVPYIDPGLPNISPRVDYMGNTINPHQ